MEIKEKCKEICELLKSDDLETIAELYNLSQYLSDNILEAEMNVVSELFDPFFTQLKQLADQHPEYGISITDDYFYYDTPEVYFNGCLLQSGLPLYIVKRYPISNEESVCPLGKVCVDIFLDNYYESDELFELVYGKIEEALKKIEPTPVITECDDGIRVIIDDNTFVSTFEQMAVRINELRLKQYKQQ